MAKLTVNSFFSGIGGFDLGFQRQNYKVLYQCENNKFCESILKKHWNQTEYANDILKVESKKLPNATVWCAGFPCQDLSVARGSNGREGLKGKNSGLFYDFFKLIEDNQPEVIILENVLGLLNSHSGNDFKIILTLLTEIGYGVSWRVFNSRFFGVPQSRQRVYICAWKHNINKATFVLHESFGSVKSNSPRELFTMPHTDISSGITVPSLAYCLAATSGRHTGTDWSRTYVSYGNRVRRLIPSEAEALQGFPKDWTLPERNQFKKINESDFDSVRYHAIGNAVSVPIIEWIAKRIKTMLNTDCESNYNLLLDTFKDFSKSEEKSHNYTTNETNKIKWNTGGISYLDKIFDCKVYDSPSKSVESRLIDCIQKDYIEDRYFLSSVAAKGILRRVQSQNRTLFIPLKESLHILANSVKLQAVV